MRTIRGEPEGYEFLTSFRVGSLSPTTTSTTYEQPYSNEYQAIVPRNFARDSFGYNGLYVSLSGRLTVGDGAEAYIRANADGSAVTETEYVSETGVDFRNFHTDRGPLEEGGMVRNLDFELKSSDGTVVEAHGYTYVHLWAQIE